MTQTIDHKIGALLVDFSGLSPNDAMAFIKILNRSNKMSKLLLDYVSLDEQEAAAFVAGMNHFVFSSAGRKKKLREQWLAAMADAAAPPTDSTSPPAGALPL
jgi:hypothetical protein